MQCHAESWEACPFCGRIRAGWFASRAPERKSVQSVNVNGTPPNVQDVPFSPHENRYAARSPRVRWAKIKVIVFESLSVQFVTVSALCSFDRQCLRAGT